VNTNKKRHPCKMRVCERGLDALERRVDYHTYVYILRALYGLVFRSFNLKETKGQLKLRIKRFESRSRLPCLLSILPVQTLLRQLDDAQYIYPLCDFEITLPVFL